MFRNLTFVIVPNLHCVVDQIKVAASYLKFLKIEGLKCFNNVWRIGNFYARHDILHDDIKHNNA
jgi:hypothetical protein